MGRGDGIHAGTGEEPSDGLLDLLEGQGADAPTLLNEPEAQWHWASVAQQRPNAMTVWRASPDEKPAQSGWDAHAYSREIFKNLDAHHDRTGVYPSDVMLLNELNLDYERGDSKNDGGAFDTNPGNWQGLYSKLATFLGQLLDECDDRAKDRNWAPRWWFPGWAPGHGEMDDDIASIWVPTAMRYDGVTLHAYHDRDTITDTVVWYARTFPDQPLLLGEWNMSGLGGDWRSAGTSERKRILAERVDEEARVRSRLQAIAEQLPRFSATYFIHYWESDDSHEHDIRGVDQRHALWDGRIAVVQDDYVLPSDIATQPKEPTVEPDTFPLPVDDQGNEWQADTATVLAGIRSVAPQEIDPSNPDQSIRLLKALCIAESGQTFQAQERWYIWSDHGLEAVRQRNLGYAAQILGWGKDVGTNDFSAGVAHQAWAWWDQFPGNPVDPNDPHRWDVNGWLNFRKEMIQDHGYALRYACQRMKPYYDQRPNDLQWVLERYNKPNAEVSSGVRQNYARALVLADELYPEDGHEDVGGDPGDVVVPGGTTRFEDNWPDFAPAGTFSAAPGGVILHGSRSGRASNPMDAEYSGTANWEVINPEGLGWNATIGHDVVAVHLDARHWGWNARAASPKYLAVEFAQPTNANAISDGQVQAFADWFRQHVLTVWPNIALNFPTHAEVEVWGETGYHDGKDDVFPFGDIRVDQLRARIMAALGTQPAQPEPPAAPEPGPAPESDTHKVERMTSAIGYLTGDIVDRLEHARVIAGESAFRPNPTMTEAELLQHFQDLWGGVDREYAEIGSIMDEMKRVGAEQLG
jgi:hypothetical protein